MDVKVIMRDDYRFIMSLDNEAVELLHQLSKIRNEPATDVVKRLVLGGLVLMQKCNKIGEYERSGKRNSGYVSLLFKHFLHIK